MSGTTSHIYSHDFLDETINLTVEFLSDIIIDINMIGDITSGPKVYWNHKVSQLTADISRFVELTTLLSKTIMSRKGQTLNGIKSAHIHLLFVIKAMNQAQSKDDFMALEDLIKYELKDNLTQWKIDLIPQTRKLLNT